MMRVTYTPDNLDRLEAETAAAAVEEEAEASAGVLSQ